jgi:hypothetical protein
MERNLDLGLGPPVVDVHDGEHVPLPGLELVLHTVLEPLPLNLRKRPTLPMLPIL